MILTANFDRNPDKNFRDQKEKTFSWKIFSKYLELPHVRRKYFHLKISSGEGKTCRHPPEYHVVYMSLFFIPKVKFVRHRF